MRIFEASFWSISVDKWCEIFAFYPREVYGGQMVRKVRFIYEVRTKEKC